MLFAASVGAAVHAAVSEKALVAPTQPKTTGTLYAVVDCVEGHIFKFVDEDADKVQTIVPGHALMATDEFKLARTCGAGKVSVQFTATE